MSDRVMVCVNSAPAAFAAARLAIDMVARHGGEIRALFVAEQSTVLGVTYREPTGSGKDGSREGEAILARMEAMAGERDAKIETVMRTGDPLTAVMDEADRWRPDLILIGRTGRRGPGSPMLGSLTSHVLEFSTWPVVVVPAEYGSTRSKAATN